MDRKHALKEIKKQKRDYNEDEEKSIVSRFVMTIGLVLVALVALYLFVGIFITKTITFKEKKEEKETVNIDKTTILASQIFDQKEEEYFVLVYNPEDKVKNIEQFLSLYKSKSGSIKVYKVDSSKKFNSSYIVEVVSPSLIKINNKNVVEYYEGFEEVKNVFKN